MVVIKIEGVKGSCGNILDGHCISLIGHEDFHNLFVSHALVFFFSLIPLEYLFLREIPTFLVNCFHSQRVIRKGVLCGHNSKVSRISSIDVLCSYYE